MSPVVEIVLNVVEIVEFFDPFPSSLPAVLVSTHTHTYYKSVVLNTLLTYYPC